MKLLPFRDEMQPSISFDSVLFRVGSCLRSVQAAGFDGAQWQIKYYASLHRTRESISFSVNSFMGELNWESGTLVCSFECFRFC